MMSSRALILLMDSLGVGASLDADYYGDTDADTFGHVVEAAYAGRADRDGLRAGPLKIPNLARLGLYHAAVASSGRRWHADDLAQDPQGYYGYAVEQSLGKDTPSGHWELAGVPVLFDWGYFPKVVPCFPQDVMQTWLARAGLKGVLGQKHASGTDIIDELGLLHCQTGMPIVYTSGDSVFQVAAHEEHFGLERLLRICEMARELFDAHQIGRVIARPFIGSEGHYKRTANRRDYAMPPPELTLLDHLKNAGREVIGVGKVSDIFAHQGITQNLFADGNQALFDVTLRAFAQAPAGSLVFTNFVDFDSSYGHRRDVPGYAHALEAFDARLPELEAILRPGDRVVITADHGCDPTLPGSDHTREHVPVLMFGPGLTSQFIGRRDTFADIGQSLAQHLGINRLKRGVSFLTTGLKG